jgi:lysyl-tRNA synthetase, class II
LLEIQDHEGRIQLYINRDEICPGDDKTLYNEVFKKTARQGRYNWGGRFCFITQMGEMTIHVKNFTVLNKSLSPLPAVKEKEGVTYRCLYRS